jgi:mono/diheme cytochrome c family protein
MKKFIVVVIIAGVIFACSQVHTAQPNIYNQFCYAPPGGDSPCSVIPYDVNERINFAGYDSFLDSLHQIPFDVFSWQTFMALNWPASSNGQPLNVPITDSLNLPRVWEYYKDDAEVFGDPAAGFVLRLESAKKRGQKFLYMDSKAPHPMHSGLHVDMSKLSGFEEADGHPLIDRNLNFVLYEIKLNPTEANFVTDNKLTTVQGIYNVASKTGNRLNLPASDSASQKVGSLEIKAAWRILIPSLGDDTTRYYCRKATITIDSLHTRDKKTLTLTNVTVGLVGMHIIRKTGKVSANEIWTTFEHVDNVPDNLQQAQAENRKWSFYNPLCLSCIPNAAPDTLAGDNGQYIWEPKMPYAADYAVNAPGQKLQQKFGTQAIRIYPVYKYTDMVNQVWQDKLKGTVWANYRLIGSQWQQAEVFPAPTAPNFLANTTLETFIQSNASCIGCHNGASVAYVQNKDTTKITTNLSFVIAFDAQSNSQNPQNKLKKK